MKLIDNIAFSLNLGKNEVENITELFVGFIHKQLLDGNHVAIKGLGTFENAVKPERKIFNPTNKKYTVVPEKKTVKFKPSTVLKNAVKNKS